LNRSTSTRLSSIWSVPAGRPDRGRARVRRRKRRRAETAEALSAALRFTAEGFGEGQELALFLTELNANRAALAFADETGHEDYARYNQLLLLRDRRETLKEEVMRFL